MSHETSQFNNEQNSIALNNGRMMADCFDKMIDKITKSPMDAKETVKYLFEHGHIMSREHYDNICAELAPITERPDVQRLIGQVVKLQMKVDAIKTQYARDLVATNKFYYPKPVCERQPPEITNGMNACLSCPMRKTCLLIFKEIEDTDG